MAGVLFVSYLPCVFVCPLTFFFDLFLCAPPPSLFQNAQVNKSKTLSARHIVVTSTMTALNCSLGPRPISRGGGE